MSDNSQSETEEALERDISQEVRNISKTPTKYLCNQAIIPDSDKHQSGEDVANEQNECESPPLTQLVKSPINGKGDIAKYMNCARGINRGISGPSKILPNTGRPAVPAINSTVLNSINKMNKNTITEMVQGVTNYTRNLKAGSSANSNYPLTHNHQPNLGKTGEYLPKKGSEKNMRINHHIINFKNSLKKQTPTKILERSSPQNNVRSSGTWNGGHLLPVNINRKQPSDMESDESNEESYTNSGL